MGRALLVTNDFPPRLGGIQTYLIELTRRLPSGGLIVLAPSGRSAGDDASFDRTLPFPVYRMRGPLLPDVTVARRVRHLIAAHDCDTVWFGASAPLGLLAPGLLRTGRVRALVASSHGHEVGWSMLPGARGALRRIGTSCTAVTVVSDYTRRRVASAFGPATALEPLPGGVDPAVFRPDPGARDELRRRYRLGDRPTIVCVSRLVRRKGQDALIRALPLIRSRVPGARLLLVGDGPAAGALRRIATAAGVDDAVVWAGAVPRCELAAHHCVGDVFAMPSRTRGAGLDVEGLGLVYLEASACGVPVVAGRSGGAPETVRDHVTGRVVDGRDNAALAGTLADLLADPAAAAELGSAGREWMRAAWSWDHRSTRLAHLLGLTE